MRLVRGLWSQAVRWRYVLMVTVALIGMVGGHDHRDAGFTDWLWFEFGARTLVHYNAHYNSGALGLYAHYPIIQIGPPPLALLGAFQWLPPHVAERGFAIAMALAGVWCVRCAELTVRATSLGGRDRRIAGRVLVIGFVLAALWGWQAGQWEHLDDVMAITLVMTAMMLIARRPQWWWVAAVFVGVGVASKPWAIVAAPCLLGVPRKNRAASALVMMAAAGGCWAPFVLGNSQTLHALSTFQFPVASNSVVHFLGVPLGNAPKWVRPVQFVGGAGLAAFVVRRRQWLAVPLVAFAFRVVIDPQTWFYYGLGPLAGAVLWDLAARRRWPVWTALTVVAEFVVPNISAGLCGPVRLAWFLVIVVGVIRADRPEVPTATDGSDVDGASRRPSEPALA